MMHLASKRLCSRHLWKGTTPPPNHRFFQTVTSCGWPSRLTAPGRRIRHYHASLVRTVPPQNQQPDGRPRETQGRRAGTTSTASASESFQPAQGVGSLALRFQTLHHQLQDVPPLPPVWKTSRVKGTQSTRVHSHAEQEQHRRHELYQTTLDLLRTVQTAVQRGWIQRSDPLSRQQLSTYLDWALQSLAKTQPLETAEGASTTHHCLQVLQLLRSLDISLQQCHVQSVLEVAARQGLWKEATHLFVSTIHPQQAAYTPVTTTLSVEHPIGLYCIARHAQDCQDSAVDRVLGAVTQLSMVSPSDQDHYVLAAGTALGYAGEADALTQYTTNDTTKHEWGQALVAAALHANLLAQRPDQALNLLDSWTSGTHAASVEWQWAGGAGKLLPVCRDLALRALGACTQTNTSQEALRYLEQVLEEDWTLSEEAWIGVLRSCEKDGAWETAMSVLFALLEQPFVDRGRLLPAGSLDLPQLEVASASSSSSSSSVTRRQGGQVLRPQYVDGLEIVLRTCNASGHYGVALVCAQRFANLYPEIQRKTDPTTLSHWLGSVASVSSHPQYFVTTAAVSLSGAQCHQAAHELLTLAASDDDEKGKDLTRTDSLLRSHTHGDGEPDGSSVWEDVLENVTLLCNVKNSNESLSTEDRVYFTAACTKVLRQLENHPTVGRVVLDWILNPPSTIPERLVPPKEQESLAKRLSLSSLLKVSDSLLAAVMRVVDPSTALELFMDDDKTIQDPSVKGVLSSTVAMDILFDIGEVEVAQDLLEQVLAKDRTPDLFVTAASHLFQKGDMAGVTSLYKRALTCGCLSESLSLIVLSAMSSSSNQNIDSGGGGAVTTAKARIDVATQTGRLTGDNHSAIWAEKHYWNLKERLTWLELCQLMMWRDNDSLYLDELQLALGTVQTRQKQGLGPHLASLETIAKAASEYHDDYIPTNRTRIHLVPRTRQRWFDTIQQTLQLAEGTKLVYDVQFLSNVAQGYANLGYTTELAQLVEKCLSRGLVLDNKVLEEANKVMPEPDTVDLFHSMAS